MRRLVVALLVLLAACGSASAGRPEAVTTTTVASGLGNVAALAVDGSGRLWAATASMSDDGTDAVDLVIDGAPTKVIGDVHTPLGLAWIGDSLYVAQNKEVDAFSGFDGTSFATERTVVTFGDGVGELNELVQLPDGRLALGISAPCNACTVTDPDAAAVVAFDADGTDLQKLAGGIRAPVGLTVHDGELLATMNQRDDLGDETPGDWLAVVSAGQDWGFPDASPQPPLAVLDEHAAVSGVAVVGDTAVVAEWNVGKVLAVSLEDGASTVLLDSLTHPMPVLAMPDGTVLVGDWATGTVLRLNLPAP